MATSFRHLEFAPLALRPVLRTHLVPGERVVGWATAHVEQSLSLGLLRLSLYVLPGVGTVVAGLLSSLLEPERRLMVLTDARLLLVGADRTGVVGALEDVDLATVAVSTGRWGITFRIAVDGGKARPWTIDANQSPPARRLHAALVLLAREEAERAAVQRPEREGGAIVNETSYAVRAGPRSRGPKAGV